MYPCGSHGECACAEEWTARWVSNLQALMAEPPDVAVRRDKVVFRHHPKSSKLVNQPTCLLPEANSALGGKKLHRTFLYYMDRTKPFSLSVVTH